MQLHELASCLVVTCRAWISKNKYNIFNRNNGGRRKGLEIAQTCMYVCNYFEKLLKVIHLSHERESNFDENLFNDALR